VLNKTYCINLNLISYSSGTPGTGGTGGGPGSGGQGGGGGYPGLHLTSFTLYDYILNNNNISQRCE
jgi:hypothetical protein